MGWSVGAALVAIIAAGVAVGLLREPVVLDPHTPEGTVQTYLQAVLDGDWATAHSSLTDELGETCTTIDFRYAWIPDGLTATLDDVRLEGDEAEVVVHLQTATQPDPFGGAYQTTESFDLVRDGMNWHLTGQPWPVYDCRGLLP